MDDEDSGNNNQFFWKGGNYSGRNFSVGGLAHISSPRRAGGNTRITYCAKYTPSLPILSSDYAVILASNTCPANSFNFARRFDNEDASNHNSTTGDVSPNWASTGGNGASLINFCFVPGQAGRPSWDASLNGSLIFTRAALTNTGRFYTDDEDSRNNNQYGSTNSGYTARMQNLISHGSNTWMHFGTASSASFTDLGTASDCGNASIPTIGLKCKTSETGNSSCKPIIDVAEAWAYAKNLYCKW